MPIAPEAVSCLRKEPGCCRARSRKAGRVYGNLMALHSDEGLPLAYNKDMQEDKEAIFDSVDTVKMCLPVFTKMVATMSIRRDNMLSAARRGFTNATDIADYLVKKGVPFRDAHAIVGRMVACCIEQEKNIEELGIGELKAFSEKIEMDVYEAISLETCVNERNLPGGPAIVSVKASIENARERLQQEEGN